MFGFRPEGRRIHDVDPIVAITPYLMPQRCDAQVFLSHDAGPTQSAPLPGWSCWTRSGASTVKAMTRP